MSSEIERAIARKEGRQPGLHSPAPVYGYAAEGDPLESLLEISRALTATIELRHAVQGALEVLNRRPSIARSAVTLALPDVTEVVVDDHQDLTNSGRTGGEHRFVCVTVMLDDRPIGALAVDLLPEGEDARERTERLVQAAADLLAQAVRIRHLLAGRADADPPSSPEGASLTDLVSGYEKRLIENALRTTRGNRSRAAKLLRTTERIVGYRVQQYGIDCSVFRS